MTNKNRFISAMRCITNQPNDFAKHQRKSGFSKAKLFFSWVLLGATISSTANAQTSCLTNSIRISTGYVPLSGTYVTPVNADPKWKVAGLSPDDLAVPGAATPGSNAWVINPESVMITSSTARCISFIQANNFTTDTFGTYIDTFSRQFTNCISDSIKINVNIACDDQIKSIFIDGTSIFGGQTAPPNMPNFTSWTNVTKTLFLSSGTHTVMVVAMNYPFPPTTTNYHGVIIDGTLSSTTSTNSIVNEDSVCEQYVCRDNPADSCDDLCYWRVIGNDIHDGNNVFGTLTNDDIRILTDGTQRSVIKANGFTGIKQLTPTTTLDVICSVPTGTVAPSGLRLESLPQGSGNALVVDASGYVYMAKTILTKVADNNSDLQTQVNQLQQQVQTLMTLLGINGSSATLTNTLVVSPNPSNGNMTAVYVIAGSYNTATIKVTDNQGREVENNMLTNSSGTLHITLPSSAPPGTYIFSLIADGNVLVSQKEVIVK